jgi:5-oxopent-3-ene-1,2,5-tricarboxylate decarboxylase/2-hydroxyhepta-2,4-diene-1,7-dioate isomerase
MPEFRRVLIDGTIRTVEVENDRFTWIDGRRIHVDDAIHLPPVQASKVVCVHLNYRSRLNELGWQQPPAPTYFWKSPSSLNGHKGKVIRPKGCQFLNYEGEVALVVGRTTRNIRPENAADYIMGYAVANDMGLHDFRDTDVNSMVRVKGSDTLGPLGPGIKTDWDFHHKRIRTLVDGKVVQDSTTDDFIWDPHYLLADLARSITFEPGDLIFTGTPTNSRPVEPGSTVVVEVEGLGRLENTIVEAEVGVAADFGAQPSTSEAILSIALGKDYRKSA